MEKMKMQTADIVSENMDYILEKFPNCATEVIDEEGNVKQAIDFDLLRQELSRDIVEGMKERYSFTWPGKRAAIRLANAPVNLALRPIREDSKHFDTTENLYIEGDNLDVLKLLRHTYFGKVKMIYIDPPYNTGKDFVYKDNFGQTLENYKEVSGEYDEEGNRLFKNTETNGRFHTDWLNMIYPRLKVARDLLSNDGVIFISIDDNEVENLKKVCDEIFGAYNYIEQYVWESVFRPDNSSKIHRKNAEFILCYAKNKKGISKLLGHIKGSDGLPSLTKNSMKKSVLKFPKNSVYTLLDDGLYSKGVKDSKYELLDDVEFKDSINVNEFRLKGPVIWGQDNLEKEILSGTQIIIKTEGFIPYSKKNEDTILAPNTLIPKDIVGDVLEGRAEVSNLFDGLTVFDYPKPVSLLNYLIEYWDDKEFIMLDFFSGSSSSAEAIMKANALDGGSRKYVMVQLPEKLEVTSDMTAKGKQTVENAISVCNKLGNPLNVCEVAKERIRRSGEKVLSGLEDEDRKKSLDVGFRVLRLDSSNMKDVYYNAFEQCAMLNFVDNIKDDRSSEDLLFQTMLDIGIPLSAKIEVLEIEGTTCYSVDGGYLLACFERNVEEATIRAIAQKQPYYFVMSNASASTDQLLDNFEQIFETYSKETIRRIV